MVVAAGAQVVLGPIVDIGMGMGCIASTDVSSSYTDLVCCCCCGSIE